MKKIKNLPFNLQFFAESDDENKDDGKDEGTKGNEREKTFTQSEVNTMMAKEKQEGKQSVFNALGLKDIDEAKKAIEFYNANKPKDQEEHNDGAANKELEAAKTKAEERAQKAEQKLSCVMAGVAKDSVDDVLSIAVLKVTEEKTLDKVLEEMKSVPKYAGFFESESDKGTGHDVGHSKGSDGEKSRAQRLAEQSKPKDNQNKKTYF